MVDGSKELNINQNRRTFFYHSQATPVAKQVMETELKSRFYWVLNENFGHSLIFMLLVALIFVSHVFFNIEKEVLTSFILFTTYLIGPIGFVLNASQPLFRGKIAYNKILDLKLINDGEDNCLKTVTKTEKWSSIRVENLSYSYHCEDDFEFSVGPINLEIHRGEILFIRGGNGSGKSTFAKLLVGLYQPQEGFFSLGYEKITRKNIHWYRNHFSTVFSDFYLFEHILDSSGELAQLADLEQHLEKLQLTDKVTIVDGKLSTTNLSQGQKKRLAMLLAYAEDSQIYLFDEWAADQDPVFRHYFYTELLPELKNKGKTVVVISHDEHYFSCADRIYKFDSGLAEIDDVSYVENFHFLKSSA